MTTLMEAITCRWVDGFQNHGPAVTTFNFEEEIYLYIEIYGSIYAKYLDIKWIFDEIVYPGSGWIIDDEIESYRYSKYSIGHLIGPCSAIADIYLDDIYLGSSNVFSVLPATCNTWVTEHKCIRKGCYWYNGTCNQNPP